LQKGNSIKEEAGKTYLVYTHKEEEYKILIDPDDVERLAQYKWRVSTVNKNRKKPCKVISAAIYDPKKGTYRTILLRRFLLNASQDVKVVHRNSNPFDCRKENLRRIL